MQFAICIIASGRTMALIFTLSHMFSSVTSTSAPEDIPSGSALHHTAFGDSGKQFSDDAPDSYAYINVTYKTEIGWIWEQSEAGRYGGGNIGPAFGYLVHVSSEANPHDHTGCQLPFKSTRSDRRLPRGEPWIALIKRGRCNFEIKVENAYRSNASGVLVYNDRDSTSLDKMKLSTDSGRNISAIFTYKLKGEQLAKLLENDSEVLVHITVASRSTVRNATINRTSVLFVSITFIVLMIISLAWLVFYYVQRFRYIHAKDRLSVSSFMLFYYFNLSYILLSYLLVSYLKQYYLF
ncbi:protein goliath isoform X2 [Agrilus planipennis]|uniref:Protein goliath isoform X2 n=1 Tax=Agrilus planipennis TaxID=224129 RepID=A0A7F5R712_AGRPL|nr:protein goliath isoform X2 [Agrilus planipennis]